MLSSQGREKGRHSCYWKAFLHGIVFWDGIQPRQQLYAKQAILFLFHKVLITVGDQR